LSTEQQPQVVAQRRANLAKLQEKANKFELLEERDKIPLNKRKEQSDVDVSSAA